MMLGDVMKIKRDERRLDFHDLGLAIKRAREKSCLTQEQLAYILDRTPRTIMYNENNGQHLCFVKSKSRKRSRGIPDFIKRKSREKSSAGIDRLTHEGMSHPIALALK